MSGNDAHWEAHQRAWRRPEEAIAAWADGARVDPRLLAWHASGRWWEVLEETDTTLIVSREYEHLVQGLRVEHGRPRVTFMRLPHPSGLAVDLAQGAVFVASTRNPNQVFSLRPTVGLLPRSDVVADQLDDQPLVPVASRIYPGSLYLHDLEMVGGVLHGAAAGMNAVVRLDGDCASRPVWWPRGIEMDDTPDFNRNHLQLNGIAGGATLEDSFFTASGDHVTTRKPGHRNWAVNRRGVLFSGRTREPSVRGLTRPHTPRLIDGDVWVANSGYGTVGVATGGVLEIVARLPGWTRGLCSLGRYVVAATSRVIPRFRQYAPGLDVERSVCGLHTIDRQTGDVVGSLHWPAGDQVFAAISVPATWTTGLPFSVAGPSGVSRMRDRTLFYAFRTATGPVKDTNESRECP